MSTNPDRPNRGQHYGVKHFHASRGALLHEIVRDAIGLSIDQLQNLLWLGAVYVDDDRGNLSAVTPIESGAYVRVHTTPRRFSLEGIRYPELVIFENDDFIVVDKPSGVPVHATVDNIRENLIAFLSEQLGMELLVTHRLDVATKGLVVLAKNPAFQAVFNSYLKNSRVKKIYRAAVHGEFQNQNLPARFVHYMEPSPRAPKNVQRAPAEGWAKCSLQILSVFKRKSRDGEVISDLTIELETGRTHQIRAQLSCEGFPIVGDVLYGGKPTGKSDEIALQSFALEFPEYSFSLGSR